MTTLDDPKVDALTAFIKDSFRVHENHDPVYIDVAGHLDRVAAAQHQIIFGRRGSGKSCLLVHFHRREAPARGIGSVYVNADEIKTLAYPDLLIRLLLDLFEKLPQPSYPWWKRPFRRPPPRPAAQVDALRSLLDMPASAAITHSTTDQTNARVGASLTAAAGSVGGRLEGQAAASQSSTRQADLRRGEARPAQPTPSRL